MLPCFKRLDTELDVLTLCVLNFASHTIPYILLLLPAHIKQATARETLQMIPGMMHGMVPACGNPVTWLRV